MMKRLITLVAVLAFCCAMLTSCGSMQADGASDGTSAGFEKTEVSSDDSAPGPTKDVEYAGISIKMPSDWKQVDSDEKSITYEASDGYSEVMIMASSYASNGASLQDVADEYAKSVHEIFSKDDEPTEWQFSKSTVDGCTGGKYSFKTGNVYLEGTFVILDNVITDVLLFDATEMSASNDNIAYYKYCESY